MNLRLHQITLAGPLGENGFGDGFFLENGILKMSKYSSVAYFFSDAIDSLEKGNTWNRLALRGDHLKDATYTLYVFATDVSSTLIQGRSHAIAPFLQSDRGPKAKLALFEAAEANIIVQNSNDLLLHTLEGRYLYMALVVHRAPTRPLWIPEMYVEFPRFQLVEFMPQVYQESGDFTSRFLSIGNETYNTLNYTIDTFPDYLDFSSAHESCLEYLASFVGAESYLKLVPEDLRRTFLQKATYFARRKGTGKCLEEVLSLLLRGRVQVVEPMQLEAVSAGDSKKKKLLQTLFNDGNSFVLLFDMRTIANRHVSDVAQFFTDLYKPAFTRYTFVYEKPTVGIATQFSLQLREEQELGIEI